MLLIKGSDRTRAGSKIIGVSMLEVETLPPIESIWALVLVWRIIRKIIITALCCVVYNSCAQWYAHTCEQFLHFCMLCLDVFLYVYLTFIFCVFFHVSLGHFVFVLLAFVVLGLFFQYFATRLAGKNVSKMTYFVSSGTQTLTRRSAWPFSHQKWSKRRWNPSEIEPWLLSNINRL